MRFEMPETIPMKREFVLMFFESCFPEEGNTTYVKRCDEIWERYIKPNFDVQGDIRVGSDMHRLMVEMARNYQRICNEVDGKTEELPIPYFIETAMEWKGYDYDGLERTFISENNSVDGWIRAKGACKDGFIKNKQMAVALFFTYLMFCSTDQKRNQKVATHIFTECMKLLGMTDIEPDVAEKLFNFSWQESGDKENYYTNRVTHSFDTLKNPALVLFGTTVLVLTTLVEKYNSYPEKRENYKKIIRALQNLFKRTFATQLQSATTFEAMEYELFKSVIYFEPRAKVGASSRYYPQDVFVMPKFYDFDTGAEGETPVDAFARGLDGSSQLIVAKTGYGKSIYLQSLVLCLLHKRYLNEFKNEGSARTEMPSEQESALGKLATCMSVPENMHVISVPARMYTECYKRRGEYADLTEDFVGMYLTYMWTKLPSAKQDTLSLKLGGAAREEHLKVLSNYVRSLAGQGRLLLVLDSFDEVPAGSMRTSYINALRNFCNRYCRVPQGNGTGSAHILISSRQMSDDTMRLLKAPFQNTLDMSYQCTVFGISPLQDSQREEFVTRWLRTFRSQDNQGTKPRQILDLIANNHYYEAYADNPYMLSVMCQSHAKGVSEIATEFIKTLIQRMQHNGMMAADGNTDMNVLFNSVLEHIEKYINEIALTTVMNDTPYITQSDLQLKFTAAAESMIIPGKEVSQETIRQVVQNLHELFVMQAGIIVPADERDQDYQFINDQIRFELAAKCLAESVDRCLPDYEKLSKLLATLPNCDVYAEMMVRLLCFSPKDQSKPINWMANELLLHHLVTKDYDTDDQGMALDSAMLDLVYGLYGMNIMNRKVPGRQHEAKLRGLQRLVLRRLVTSPYFSHLVVDMQAFLATDACDRNKDRMVLPVERVYND